MASKTSATENKRANRKMRSGKKRKAKNQNQGTTKSAKVLFGD
ncbi:MAG: hypothetical protein ABL958_10580 [Bdellovibrionia bacterium]